MNVAGSAVNETIEHLKFLRDGFSDEIPDEIIHSDSEDKMYKVRGSWYQGIVADMEELLMYRGKDAPEREEIDELMEYFTGSEFKQKMSGRTDATDIEKGNRLIELALNLTDSK